VKQKTRMWYLIAVSLVVDLIWIIYWAVTWGGYDNKESGLCNFTIFISVLTFVLKLIILGVTFLKVDDCKRAVTDIVPNIKSIFTGPTQAGYEQL
jgi:hypothetical protein